MLTQRVNMKLTLYIAFLFFALILTNSAHTSFSNRPEKDLIERVTSLTVPFIENQGQLKIKRAKYYAPIIPPIHISI
jgi:hypothetical protein